MFFCTKLVAPPYDIFVTLPLLAAMISGVIPGNPDIFHCMYQDIISFLPSDTENDNDDNDDDDDAEPCGGFSGDNKSPTLG